jgi:hypothetical protein
MSRPSVAPGQPGLQIILWEDIFVLIDDGDGQPSEYAALQLVLADQVTRYRGGVGCLTIVPASAKAPSREVRDAVNTALETAPLRCVCWFVEGTGFQGAMVRAVITGFRVLARPAYPTHVSVSLEEALEWMLPFLEGGAGRVARAPVAATNIRSRRAAG